MRARGALSALALVALAHAGAAAAPAPRDSATAFPLIAILCYHDLSSDPAAPLQTVPPEFLREQIRACKAAGWTFVSLAELLALRDHPERLPARTMVLTFDDGYRSFAERALPVLRAEGVRATLAIVTSFPERPPAGLPPLLSWAELRRLDAAGEVEMASHAHAQHEFVTSDPQGDSAPAIATRAWRAAEQRYEDREEYRSRVGEDLLASQRALTARLGHPAAVLVWPYGMHNEMARGLAAHAGFTATLALGGRPVSAADLRAGLLPRVMVTRRMEFADPAHPWLTAPPAAVRAAEVDLDSIWDPDDGVFSARLDRVVTRARALGATDVILPVCPDPRGDGRLTRAYAMNHQLPVLADVWSMVAARFAAARIHVWVRVPTMNLTWDWDRHPEWRVAHATGERWSTRLSPELPEARRAAVDFLTDLAVYLPVDGVLFDDDALMAPGERLASGAGDAAAKSAAIRGLLADCEQAVRAWRPECAFARALPAAAVGRTGLDERFALDYRDVLRGGGLAVIEPGPGRLSAGQVGRLARRAIGGPSAAAGGPPPVLLMLPARDLRTRGWIPAADQQEMATAALRAGLLHLGTGPIADAGEVPIGLLDDAAPVLRNAGQRR